ncbi:Hypothetical predicted protein [Paramuricea clavata]|uniref:Uncharacterized protein n=1 Tax=Paramuricea clavata TaxID=317549 RepID=A0A6S7GAB7_PARCT|nr:Hypothetical predicted protein [Paramuricea clavata]
MYRCCETTRIAQYLLVSLNGVEYYKLIDGASNTVQFLFFFEESSNAVNFETRRPALEVGDTIVMDNQATQDNINGSDSTSTSNAEWTNEIKINLLRIEEQERSRGRGFMKRMKEAWDSIYLDKPMSAQCLRDNAARFRKDKAVGREG